MAYPLDPAEMRHDGPDCPGDAPVEANLMSRFEGLIRELPSDDLYLGVHRKSRRGGGRFFTELLKHEEEQQQQKFTLIQSYSPFIFEKSLTTVNSLSTVDFQAAIGQQEDLLICEGESEDLLNCTDHALIDWRKVYVEPHSGKDQGGAVIRSRECEILLSKKDHMEDGNKRLQCNACQIFFQAVFGQKNNLDPRLYLDDYGPDINVVVAKVEEDEEDEGEEEEEEAEEEEEDEEDEEDDLPDEDCPEILEDYGGGPRIKIEDDENMGSSSDQPNPSKNSKGGGRFCCLCETEISSEEDYQQHLLEAHQIATYSRSLLVCQVCLKRFKLRGMSKKSRWLGVLKKIDLHCKCRRKGGKRKVDKKSVAAKVCKTIPTGSYDEWKHRLKVCQLCTFKYKGIPELVIHVETAHGPAASLDLAKQIEEKGVSGMQWNRELKAKPDFKQQRLMASEVQLAVRNLDRSCEFCPKMFMNFGALRIHMELKHPEKEWEDWTDTSLRLYATFMSKFPQVTVTCDVCGRLVAKHLMKKHSYSHRVRLKKCDVCGEEVKSNSFASHRAKHFVDDHLCTICGSLYKSRQALRNHVIIHAKDRKKYKCLDCGKVFSWNKDLIIHTRKAHLNEDVGNKLCHICNKVVACLSKHLLVHSAKKRFACATCGQEGRRRDTIVTHIRGRHKGIGEILDRGKQPLAADEDPDMDTDGSEKNSRI